MGIKNLLTAAAMVIATVFIGTGIYAGTNVQDVIKLKTVNYPKHTKKIVKFSHGKHQEDYKNKYPELYKNNCGECHHDRNNQPRKDLKAGMQVKKCIECHKKPGYVKGKKAKALSDKEKRKYHANALHDNCQGLLDVEIY
jgi:mono/diheme cytochrome c family protein